MAESVTLDSISAVFSKQIKGLRPTISNLSKQAGIVREKMKDLAPKVIGLFKKLQAEYPSITFVEFARMFDPTVPTFAADKDGAIGYRNHKTYYTLNNMRRLDATAGRGRGTARTAGGVRDSATDALARSLATILQIVQEPESVWGAVQQEFAFGERLMTRLRKRVEETKPLFTIPTKPVKVGAVIHMTRTSGESAPAETPMPKNVQRVKVA